MIKNIFEVNDEEKSRILNLHENATKRQYILEENQESGIELINFIFPFPKQFFYPGGLNAFYDKTNNKVLIELNREKFETVDKTKLEENPHNLKDFNWVKDLNSLYNNSNDRRYFTPSFDANNRNLVWVAITINKKNEAKVDNVYPLDRTLPE